jgi:hypothetical protein
MNDKWWLKRETEWHFIGISESPIPDVEFIKECSEECLPEELETKKQWGETIKCDKCNRPPCHYCN